MAQHLKQAEQQLMLATEIDRADPLKAAELYVSAIKHLRQATFQEADPAAARKAMLLREATERFEDCERRIQKQKEAKEATRIAGAGGSGKSVGGAPQAPKRSANEVKGWFTSLFSGSGSGSTESDPGGTKAAPSANVQSTYPAAARTVAGQGHPVQAPPAHPPPSLPAGRGTAGPGSKGDGGAVPSSQDNKEMMEKLKGVDKALAKMVLDDIVSHSPGVKFDGIAGLEGVKHALQEAIILPSLRPDLFHGIRAPPKGILLFGPPGTGKTLLAKAVATESNCKFFSLSASSLTSKWVGQAEKLVKALFAVAAALEPSVLFIDEVDSVLSARSSSEHDAMRRLKTEFLVQFDGVSTSAESRVVVVAATNRPQELDEAVRRRFTKRLFVPLPEKATRIQLVGKLLEGQRSGVTSAQLQRVGDLTEGYSGSDLAAVCKEAAMAPIRDLGRSIQTVSADKVRAITAQDLVNAVNATRSSVDQQQLQELQEWNSQFGSAAA